MYKQLYGGRDVGKIPTLWQRQMRWPDVHGDWVCVRNGRDRQQNADRRWVWGLGHRLSQAHERVLQVLSYPSRPFRVCDDDEKPTPSSQLHVSPVSIWVGTCSPAFRRLRSLIRTFKNQNLFTDMFSEVKFKEGRPSHKKNTSRQDQVNKIHDTRLGVRDTRVYVVHLHYIQILFSSHVSTKRRRGRRQRKKTLDETRDMDSNIIVWGHVCR
jgi:hypothetical protein